MINRNLNPPNLMEHKHNSVNIVENNSFQEIAHAVKGSYSKYRGFTLFVIVFLMFCLAINSSWKVIPDGALYLELGESIAQGDGYVFNGEPHTYVPPGYPAMVAVVVVIAGKSFLAYRILMACLGILTAIAGYFLVVRLCGKDTGFVAGGLFACNHVLLSNSTFTSSDVPFALAVLLALNAIVAVPRSKTIWLSSIFVGLLAGLPALIRVNGWGLPPAMAFFLFCTSGSRSITVRLGSVALFIMSSLLPTVIWDLYRSSFPPSFNEGTYLNAISGRSLETQGNIILRAAWDYLHETTYALSSLSLKAYSLEFILPFLVLVGIVVAMRNKERLLVPLTVIQFGGMLLSPAGSRYIIALIPGMNLFLALGALRVSAWVGQRFPGRNLKFLHPRFIVLSLFTALAVFNCAHNLVTVFQARTPCQNHGAESVRDLPFFTAGRWLRDNAAHSVVLTMHPRVIHYLSGLPTVELVRSGVPEHQVWIDKISELQALISARKPRYFFSDASQQNLLKQALEALEGLDLKLEDLDQSASSTRFRLWKIIGENGESG